MDELFYCEKCGEHTWTLIERDNDDNWQIIAECQCCLLEEVLATYPKEKAND